MPRSPLMDLAFGFMPAQMIHVATEIGVADAFTDDRPRSSIELAAATGAHAPSLHRLLRGLTGCCAASPASASWSRRNRTCSR